MIDFGAEPRLAIGIAGNQMPVAALKRLWPVFIAPKVRDWVVAAYRQRHRRAARHRRPTCRWRRCSRAARRCRTTDCRSTSSCSGTAMRPVEGLPPIREADLTARITGRTATIIVGKGIVDVSPGRRLNLSNGVFEVPDMHPNEPPARVRFRVEGPVPAAAELLALERLREFSGAPFDPATTRGTVTAQINLAHAAAARPAEGLDRLQHRGRCHELQRRADDVQPAGRSADAAGHRQQPELPDQRRCADRRHAGADRISQGDRPSPTPRFALQATLDDAARARLGLDLGTADHRACCRSSSPAGSATTENSRFNVEADLTPLKVDSLLPGWVKPAGTPARAAFTFVQATRARCASTTC